MSNEQVISGQAISTLRSNSLARRGIMKPSTTALRNRKKTACSAKEFSDPSRTGNVTAVSTREYVTKE